MKVGVKWQKFRLRGKRCVCVAGVLFSTGSREFLGQMVCPSLPRSSPVTCAGNEGTVLTPLLGGHGHQLGSQPGSLSFPPCHSLCRAKCRPPVLSTLSCAQKSHERRRTWAMIQPDRNSLPVTSFESWPDARTCVISRYVTDGWIV